MAVVMGVTAQLFPQLVVLCMLVTLESLNLSGWQEAKIGGQRWIPKLKT